MYRLSVIPAAVFSVVAISAATAETRTPVDLELILAVDVSGSIDDDEALLQREGYINAFRHPDLVRAIRGGMLQRIAVAYYEWAGFGHIRTIVGWTLIEDRETAFAFADSLTRDPPLTARRTAISAAIEFAVPYFERNDFEGTRRVVDISGDGPNNWGTPVIIARDKAVAAGVTINGLPIMNGREGPSGWPQQPHLDLYYRDCVIGGPGAFIVVANSFEDFGTAIRRKLILEIAGRSPTARLEAVATGITPPCDIGERRWRDLDDY